MPLMPAPPMPTRWTWRNPVNWRNISAPPSFFPSTSSSSQSAIAPVAPDRELPRQAPPISHRRPGSASSSRSTGSRASARASGSWGASTTRAPPTSSRARALSRWCPSARESGTKTAARPLAAISETVRAPAREITRSAAAMAPATSSMKGVKVMWPSSSSVTNPAFSYASRVASRWAEPVWWTTDRLRPRVSLPPSEVRHRESTRGSARFIDSAPWLPPRTSTRGSSFGVISATSKNSERTGTPVTRQGLWKWAQVLWKATAVPAAQRDTLRLAKPGLAFGSRSSTGLPVRKPPATPGIEA